MNRGNLRRSAGILLVLGTIATALFSGTALADPPPAQFSYNVYPAGWNLVSFGGQGQLNVAGSGPSPISGSLYTWQPNDRAYETTDLAHVVPGLSYWVNFNYTFSVLLQASSFSSTKLSLPAGQCAMIGNPSTLGSARVTGADRVSVYSAAAGEYVAESLLGIGRGAWACNDSTATETVAVAFNNNLAQITWPDCCLPRPVANGGQGVIVFHNDSPAPMLLGLRQTDVDGSSAPLTADNFFRDAIPACAACPEYGTHNNCNASATSDSVNLAPGTYTMHIQSDAANVADIQLDITITPDTSYDVCFFVSANRPQYPLP